MPEPIRVLISYSHDSEDHRERVRELALRLRQHGVESRLDRFVPEPTDVWTTWMRREIDNAHKVLVVCTEPNTGLGVAWEWALLQQEIYERRGEPGRVLPVVMRPADRSAAFAPLSQTTVHDVSEDAGFARLVRALHGLPYCGVAILEIRHRLAKAA